MSAPYHIDVVWNETGPDQRPTSRLDGDHSAYNFAKMEAERVLRCMIKEEVYALHIYNAEGLLLSSVKWDDEEKRPITVPMV